MRLTGLVAISGLLLVTFGLLAPVAAQEAGEDEGNQETQAPPPAEPGEPPPAEPGEPPPAEPVEPPSAEPGEAPPAEPGEPPPAAEPQQEKKKFRFALYVEAYGGSVDADEFDASIETSSALTTETTFGADDQLYTRFGLGWKMPNEKGVFQLQVTNYREDEYTLQSTGLSSAVFEAPGHLPPESQPEPLPWWHTDISGGELLTTRTPPLWTDNPVLDPETGEMAGDQVIQEDEITYPGIDVLVTRPVPKSMQNRVQYWDLLYGRTFGPRRFDARWWAGLRYFIYEGTIPMTACLASVQGLGRGYTDGAALGVMGMRQETSGVGPTGALEVRYNAFSEQLLQVFIKAQTAVMFLDVNSDSQPFITLYQPSAADPVLPLPAHFEQQRSKSTWQNSLEAGLRVNLKAGVSFELAYNVSGFLDVILVPTEINIATGTSRETSALYTTADHVLRGWRAGASFQF
jgi:hypothetical protein